MKPVHVALLPLLILIALPASASTSHVLPLTTAQTRAAGITLVSPRPAAGGQGLAYSGRVTPAADAEWVITAPLDGVVTRLRVDEGSMVRGGTALLDLQAPEAPRLAAEWTRQAGAARLAAAERQRDRALHAEGIIPARRLEAAEQRALEAETARDAARQTLRLLGVQPDEARRGQLMLRAPSTAVVTRRSVTLGQRVNAGDALIHLADPARLALELHVPISDSQSFAAGDRLQLADPATDRAMPGVTARVTQVGWGAADNQGSTVRVRASLSGDGLRPGQWLNARTPGKATSTPGWQVPAAAVLRNGDRNLVFVQRPGGFLPVIVTRMGEQAGQVRVQGGLAAGDRLAQGGLLTFKALLNAREAP